MASGLQKEFTVKATYDFAVDGGVIGAIGLRKFIPDNAIITGGFIDVITTCTTASADAGTMAISVNSADDIVAAIAVSDATNVWDAGLKGVLPNSPVLNTNAADGDTAVEFAGLIGDSLIKTTASREVTATIATQAFTAGKFHVYLNYVLPGE